MMNARFYRRLSLGTCGAAVIAPLLMCSSAAAVTKSWDGSGTTYSGNSWSGNYNWLPTGVPNDTNPVFVGDTSIAYTEQQTLDSNISIENVIFDSAGMYGLAGGTGGSYVLTLVGDGGTSPLITLDQYFGGSSSSATFYLGGLGGPGYLYVYLNTTGDLDIEQPSGDTRTMDVTGTIEGPGGFNKTGDGTLILVEPNTYTGTTTVTAGTLNIGSSATLGDSSSPPAVDLNGGELEYGGAADKDIPNAITLGGGAVNVVGSGLFQLSGEITGTAALDKLGQGSLILKHTNYYSGGTVAEGGVLYTQATNALPYGGPVAISTSDGNYAGLALQGYNQSVSDIILFAGKSSTSYAIADLQGGTLTLGGDISLLDNSVYPGYGIPAFIQGTGGGTIDLDGGTRTVNVAGNYNANDPYGYLDDLYISPTITDGGLAITGTDSVADGSTLAAVSLSGTNTYSLGTTVNNAILDISSDDNLGNTSGSLTLNGSILNTHANISSSRSIVLGTGGGQINMEGYTVSYGTISGSGYLNIYGAGTFTIAAAPTYTGNTTVYEGALEYDITSGSVSVGSGATISVGVSGSLAAGGAVDPFTDGSTGDHANIVNYSLTSGGGGFSVTAGSKSIGALSGSGDTVVSNTMTTHSLEATSIDQHSLTIHGTVFIRPRTSGTPTFNTVNMLTVSGVGATLDIQDNALVIDYGMDTDPVATIRDYLISAYDAGYWDGPGISSSNPTSGAGVGYADSATDAIGRDGSGNWLGYPLDSTSVVVLYTWYGDCNLDGAVDSTDFALMDTGPANDWYHGDLNYDGTVNGDDWALFILGFSTQTNSLPTDYDDDSNLMTANTLLSQTEAEFAGESIDQIKAQVQAQMNQTASITSLPEPGVCAGLAALGVLGVRRRRRNAL